jgi:hypothetical protein
MPGFHACPILVPRCLSNAAPVRCSGPTVVFVPVQDQPTVPVQYQPTVQRRCLSNANERFLPAGIQLPLILGFIKVTA